MSGASDIERAVEAALFAASEPMSAEALAAIPAAQPALTALAQQRANQLLDLSRGYLQPRSASGGGGFE